MGQPHLIGAYGMFWERDAVNWAPGITPNKWQLLGFRGQHRPKLRVCDVRNAQGFYVLFDEFRATYVGLARGRGGIGARLKAHHHHRKEWNRFCWFAFDDIVDAAWSSTWSDVAHRHALSNMSADFVLRESEALLIAILGTSQNNMRFQGAQRWHQLTDGHFVHRGLGHRVDVAGFTDPYYRGLTQS